MDSTVPEAAPAELKQAYELYIPPCIKDPKHHHHPPPQEKPLRIQIEGPFSCVKKLFPDAQWHIDVFNQIFPQPAAPRLASLAFEEIYGRKPCPDRTPGDLVVRDQYLGWITEDGKVLNEIDYYGVTFDHLVAVGDDNPEVLQINLFEMEDDDGAYANMALPFDVDHAEYFGKKILAVHRCCQKRKGTQDQYRVNFAVRDREKNAEASDSM